MGGKRRTGSLIGINSNVLQVLIAGARSQVLIAGARSPFVPQIFPVNRMSFLSQDLFDP
jgi:hypothetical protein